MSCPCVLEFELSFLFSAKNWNIILTYKNAFVYLYIYIYIYIYIYLSIYIYGHTYICPSDNIPNFRACTVTHV